jgi:hypothetical protein
MKFTKFEHEEVGQDGKCKSGGAVHTNGKVILIRGSCGLPDCSCSDGYFLTVVLPLSNGIVEGIEVKFDDYNEMKKVLKGD